MSLCDKDLRQSLCPWISLWIGIWNLYYFQKETLFQAFSDKFCEFLHNDGFWDFMWIILQILGRLLLDFLLLNQLFVNVTKIKDLTILRLYPVKLTRISFLMKSRFILSDYCIESKVSASFYIQSECRKMWTADTFYPVLCYERC